MNSGKILFLTGFLNMIFGYVLFALNGIVFTEKIFSNQPQIAIDYSVILIIALCLLFGIWSALKTIRLAPKNIYMVLLNIGIGFVLGIIFTSFDIFTSVSLNLSIINLIIHYFYAGNINIGGSEVSTLDTFMVIILFQAFTFAISSITSFIILSYTNAKKRKKPQKKKK